MHLAQYSSESKSRIGGLRGGYDDLPGRGVIDWKMVERHVR